MDWAALPPSPADRRARAGWLVLERWPSDGVAPARAVEVLVTSDRSSPVQVDLVSYGPRGGVYVHMGGTAAALQHVADEAAQLCRLARSCEAARP